MTAALDFATGDAVIPMDVDLQDPPELIIEMLAKWREGYDVVYAARSTRNSDSFFKRKTALWFYFIFNKILNNNAGLTDDHKKSALAAFLLCCCRRCCDNHKLCHCRSLSRVFLFQPLHCSVSRLLFCCCDFIVWP